MEAAYALGLSRADVDALVVRPLRTSTPIVMDGRVFEPGSYTVEIKPCPFVPADSPPAHAYQELSGSPVTDEFIGAPSRSESSAIHDEINGRERRGAAVLERPDLNATATGEDIAAVHGDDCAGPSDSHENRLEGSASPEQRDPSRDRPDGAANQGVQPHQPQDPTHHDLYSNELWKSPEVVLFFTLVGVSLGAVSLLGLPWFGALVAIVIITGLQLLAFRALSPVLHQFVSWAVGSSSGPPRAKRRWPAIVALSLSVGVAGTILYAVATGGSDVPAEAAVVDARTGEVFEHEKPKQPTSMSGAQIEGGPIFRACNLTAERRCLFPLDDLTVNARVGDEILFRVRLHEPYGGSLNYVKVAAHLGHGVGTIKPSLSIEWPTVRGSSRPFESLEGIDSPTIRLSSDGRRTLDYINGSTVLKKSGRQEILAQLPDGIVSPGGIVLKNVGAPPGCWNCDLDFVRFIDFRARVL